MSVCKMVSVISLLLGRFPLSGSDTSLARTCGRDSYKLSSQAELQFRLSYKYRRRGYQKVAAFLPLFVVSSYWMRKIPPPPSKNSKVCPNTYVCCLYVKLLFLRLLLLRMELDSGKSEKEPQRNAFPLASLIFGEWSTIKYFKIIVWLVFPYCLIACIQKKEIRNLLKIYIFALKTQIYVIFNKILY